MAGTTPGPSDSRVGGHSGSPVGRPGESDASRHRSRSDPEGFQRGEMGGETPGAVGASETAHFDKPRNKPLWANVFSL